MNKNPRLGSFLSISALRVLGGCTTHQVAEQENAGNEPSLHSASADATAIANSSGTPKKIAIHERVTGKPTVPDSSDNRELKTAAIDLENQPSLIVSPVPTHRQATDMWVRLRGSFSLEYSNPEDPNLAKFENWYARHPKYFDRLSARAYWYIPYILEQVEARDMPAELALLPAIESAFRPEAVSRSNAVGMWQFIGITGKRIGLRKDWWMDGRRDLVHSTRAALDYLEFLSSEFNGDWELVMAAYNAGEGTIRRAVKSNRSAGKPATYKDLKLRKETREYVPKLFALRNIINEPDRFGISLTPIPNQHTLAVIDAYTQTDLVVAASLIPISAKELGKLNQGYKRGVTPPSGPHHIVVPVKYSEALATGLADLGPNQRLRWARHEVRKGEYLGRIARKHGVTVAAIKSANGLSSNLIKPGQELKIPLSSGFQQYAKASVSDVTIQDGDTVYTVKRGDNLWNISQASGIPLQELLKWNNLSKQHTLQPGQKIVIRRPS